MNSDKAIKSIGALLSNQYVTTHLPVLSLRMTVIHNSHVETFQTFLGSEYCILMIKRCLCPVLSFLVPSVWSTIIPTSALKYYCAVIVTLTLSPISLSPLSLSLSEVTVFYFVVNNVQLFVFRVQLWQIQNKQTSRRRNQCRFETNEKRARETLLNTNQDSRGQGSVYVDVSNKQILSPLLSV